MSFSSEKLRALLSSSSPSPPAAPSPLPSSSTSAASALSPSSSSSSTSASLTATSSVPSPLSPAVEALIRSYELPVDQSAQEQVELCVEAALACARLGHMRKFGFFLIQAAGLYQELHQHSACTSILQAVQPLYRLHPTMVDSSEEELEEAASSVRALTLLSADRRQERGVTEQRWVTLHRSILEHLIYTAHLTNSQTHTTAHPSTPRAYQKPHLRSSMMPLTRPARGCGAVCRCAAVCLQWTASAVDAARPPRPELSEQPHLLPAFHVLFPSSQHPHRLPRPPLSPSAHPHPRRQQPTAPPRGHTPHQRAEGRLQRLLLPQSAAAHQRGGLRCVFVQPRGRGRGR